jgi:hypothetical protein
MSKATCFLCAAGSKRNEVAGAFIHVEHTSEDGKPELVVCADSSFKPKDRTVAPRSY